MRRTIIAAATLIGLSVAVGLPGGAEATSKMHSFTAKFLGAQVSATEAVYATSGTDGNGAAVQTAKLNHSGTGGTSSSITYDGRGTAVSQDSFTLSAPNAKGIITINGSGHFVRGTGRYKHLKGTYTFTGTFDTKTTIAKVAVTGSESF